MHLVITISQFSLTQFQKTNNKEIQLPLKVKYKYFFLKAFSFMNYQRKSCQKLSLTSKRKSQWQLVKIRWSKCPHQLAQGKFSSRRTTKKQKSLLSKKLFLSSIMSYQNLSVILELKLLQLEYQQLDQCFATQKIRVCTLELFRWKRQRRSKFSNRTGRVEIQN